MDQSNAQEEIKEARGRQHAHRSGHMHANETTDLMAQLRSGIRSARTTAGSIDADTLNYRQRAEIVATKDHLETALAYVERIYKEMAS